MKNNLHSAVFRWEAWGKAFLIVISIALLIGMLPQAEELQAAPKAAQDLYVTSLGDDTVKVYDGVTGVFIRNFVTAGSGGLDEPWGMIFGPDGNLYVASSNNDAIMRYYGSGPNAGLPFPAGANPGAQFVTPGSGGLDTPYAVAFGPDGNLYVASAANDRILRYNGTTGAYIDTFVAAGSGGLDSPAGLVFNGSYLYVTSGFTGNVKRYNATTGAYDGTFSTSPVINNPSDILTDGSNLIVSSVNTPITNTGSVWRVNGTSGAVTSYIPANLATNGGLHEAYGITIGPTGTDLYVTDHLTNQILRYTLATGAPLGVFANSGNGLSFPKDVVFGPSAATVCVTTTIGISSVVPNPVALGNSVTVSYVVTPTSGLPPNAGSVLVNDGTGGQCTGGVTAGASTSTGSCALTSPSGGIKTVTAAYTGDGVVWCSSAQATGSFTVHSCGSSLTVSSSSTTQGQNVTFTARFSPTACTVSPTTVQFLNNGVPIGSPVPIVNGAASMTTSQLSVGNHTISVSGPPTCGVATCSALAALVAVNANGAGQAAAPKEVPEADTLLLLAGGMGGLGTWLGWQRRRLFKRK